jgi:hypothetical protein
LKFSKKTATGPLRKHLFETHLDAWISGCDELSIKILAKEAQPAVEGYRRQKGQTYTSPESDSTKRKPYSKEAFVDAIIEFIAGDDQVRSVTLL